MTPGYTGGDLVGDAAGVLDAYGLAAAHLVGVSAGGAFAQLLALDHPDRVLSLVLISTSPATTGDRRLPPPTEEFGRFVAAVEVDWSDPESVIEYLVDYSRLLAGGQRPFDEAASRDLARREVERARFIAAVQNHDHIADDERPPQPLSSIGVPTLVIHGTADPMFPLGHGEALSAEVPDAALLPLQGAGHGVDRADWQTIVGAIAEHTAPTDPASGSLWHPDARSVAGWTAVLRGSAEPSVCTRPAEPTARAERLTHCGELRATFR